MRRFFFFRSIETEALFSHSHFDGLNVWGHVMSLFQMKFQHHTWRKLKTVFFFYSSWQQTNITRRSKQFSGISLTRFYENHIRRYKILQELQPVCFTLYTALNGNLYITIVLWQNYRNIAVVRRKNCNGNAAIHCKTSALSFHPISDWLKTDKHRWGFSFSFLHKRAKFSIPYDQTYCGISLQTWANSQQLSTSIRQDQFCLGFFYASAAKRQH